MMMTLPFTKAVNALAEGSSFLLSSVTGKAFVPGLPPAISVELTNNCNLHCRECHTGSGRMTRGKGFMDIYLFDKIISELRPYIYYLLLNFQGESMMHPLFFSFLGRTGSLNTTLSTNGHFLSVENADKIVRSGLGRLVVSLDGMDQETYSSYRTGGDLNTVLEGIRNISNANKRAGSPLKLEIQFLVNRGNENQIHSARQFALEMNASFRLKSMQIINSENFEKWLPSGSGYSRYKKKNGEYVIKNQYPNRCARLWLNPVITWDGKVIPCCFDKDAEYIMGDLNEDTFRDIWYGPKYRIFRKSILSGRYMIDICRNCTSGLRGVYY
jgi:radical SAM protein with 4Fe4S-binding SPASM domain